MITFNKEYFEKICTYKEVKILNNICYHNYMERNIEYSEECKKKFLQYKRDRILDDILDIDKIDIDKLNIDSFATEIWASNSISEISSVSVSIKSKSIVCKKYLNNSDIYEDIISEIESDTQKDCAKIEKKEDLVKTIYKYFYKVHKQTGSPPNVIITGTSIFRYINSHLISEHLLCGRNINVIECEKIDPYKIIVLNKEAITIYNDLDDKKYFLANTNNGHILGFTTTLE